MKTQTLVKVAVIAFVILLCVGFALIYSPQFKLKAGRNESNLYSLVPPSATMVLEVGDAGALLRDIENLDNSEFEFCSQKFNLLFYLNSYLYTLLEEEPQLVSPQTKKVLFSFHEQDSLSNQIVYCYFGKNDYKYMDRFVRNYCESMLPTSQFNYRGEDIRVYSLLDGSPMACCITSNYLIVSRSRKLIEEAIDAHFSGESLLNDPLFNEIADRKKRSSNLLLARVDEIGIGRGDSLSNNSTLSFGEWVELIPQVNEHGFSFTGISHDYDNKDSFVSLLRKQQAIHGLPGHLLPSSTYFFNHYSVKDLWAITKYINNTSNTNISSTDSIQPKNNDFLVYLNNNAHSDALLCHFRKDDNDTIVSAVVAGMNVYDMADAEKELQKLSKTKLKRNLKVLDEQIRVGNKKLSVYQLTGNIAFNRLVGFDKTNNSIYLCFYGGRLLMASNLSSLQSYIKYLVDNKTLDKVEQYQHCSSLLNDTYHYTTMIDFSTLSQYPETYTRFIPSYFLSNASFFNNYNASVQLSCLNNVVFVNLVFHAKDK